MNQFYSLLLLGASLLWAPLRGGDFYTYDDSSNTVFVYGEWLYWMPVVQDPINWENKDNQVSITPNGGFPPSLSNNSFQVESLNYDFSSGYRLGGGFRIGQESIGKNYRPLQVESEFVAFKQTQSSQNTNIGYTSIDDGTTTTTIENTLLPRIPYVSSSPFNPTFGTTEIDLDFTRVDVDLAWPISFRSNILFTLKAGSMFAWVENNWKSHWLTTTTDFQADLKWKWWGGGLSGGADVYIPLVMGLAFVVDADFGLLYGPMKQKESYLYVPDPSLEVGSPYTDSKAKYRFRSFQPEASFGLTLDYIRKFKKNGALHLAIGWEFSWWFLLNQFGRVNAPNYSNTSTTDIPNIQSYFDVTPTGLGFQGLKVRSGYQF